MIDKQKIRQILDDNSNDSGDNCWEFTRAEIDKTIEDIYNLVSVPAETIVRASEPTANGAVADRIILKRIKANEVGLRCAGCFFDSEDHHCQAFLLKPDNEELVKCLGKKEGEGNYIYIPE